MIKSALIVIMILASTTAFAKKGAPKQIILDVRTVEEYQGCHLKGAKNINFLATDFKAKISQLDRNQFYRLHCRTGNRSGKAIEVMKELGFKQLENLGNLNDAKNKTNGTQEGPGC